MQAGAQQSGSTGAEARDIGRRLRAGESRALSELYDAHGPALFRLLLAMLGRQADAEDALQETFAKVVARASGGSRLPGLGPFDRVRDWRAYLLGAARNEALSVLRRRREFQMDEESAWEQLPEPGAQSGAGAQAHDWPRLLARLPLEQREVVVLKVWEQMTFAQIARVVGVSPNTAMSRYRYAIERLRLWCRQAEHEEADHE